MSVSERFEFLKLPKTIQFSCNEASEYSAVSVSERLKFLKLPKTIQFSCNEASEYSAVSVSERFKFLKLPKTIQLSSYIIFGPRRINGGINWFSD